MDLSACSTWHSRADTAIAGAVSQVAEAAVSSTALSNAANLSTGTDDKIWRFCLQASNSGLRSN